MSMTHPEARGEHRTRSETLRDLEQRLRDPERLREICPGLPRRPLNRRHAIGLLTMIRNLLFPCFYPEDEVHMTTSELLEHVDALLVRELEAAGARDGGAAAAPETTARRFLESLPAIQTRLLKDVEAMYHGDPAAQSRHEIIVAYQTFRAVLIYRIAHRLWELQVPLLPRLMTEYAHEITGVDIHPGAEIGEYFCIDHGTGIVIGETAHIGDHVKIYQGVTLGALSLEAGQRLKGRRRHPTVEDHVTLYANSTVLGGETVIGSHAVIGGGAFITRSVPPGTRVMVEATEIPRGGSREGGAIGGGKR